jgi:hypothetical protein
MYYKIISLLALLLLFYLIATSGVDSYFLYGDESGYFLNLELIDKYGISTEFLQHFSGMAGPLHPILHWLLKPLSAAIPPYIRFVNFVILCIFIYHFKESFGWRISWIPMTFICAGYAMTEFPAMLCLLWSVLLLRRDALVRLQTLMLAGICLALAIAGRWNYLILLPLFWIWLALKNKDLYNINRFDFTLRLVIFIATSLSFPLWILYAWGGIVPPEAAAVAGYGTFDIVPHHFVLSSCFAGLSLMLLCPQWFLKLSPYRKNFITVCLLVGCVNFSLNLYSFLPAKSVFNRFLDENQQLYIANIFGTFALVTAILFLFNFYLQIKQNAAQLNYLFYAAATLVILVTAIKTTHVFSSRYPYQALPFLLLLLENERPAKPHIWEMALGISAVAWGLLTWLSYQSIYS